MAVYKEALKTHSPKKIALFGTSAGAILTAETAVQLRKLGLPLPAALGFFSGFADMARRGDAASFYSVSGFWAIAPSSGPMLGAYVGKTDPKDPVLSPMYADLKGFPPTLCMTGTRDICLSGTVDFHRALLRAGVDAHLMVFDAMPHAHWYSFNFPESKEALEGAGPLPRPSSKLIERDQPKGPYDEHHRNAAEQVRARQADTPPGGSFSCLVGRHCADGPKGARDQGHQHQPRHDKGTRPSTNIEVLSGFLLDAA